MHQNALRMDLLYLKQYNRNLRENISGSQHESADFSQYRYAYFNACRSWLFSNKEYI